MGKTRKSLERFRKRDDRIRIGETLMASINDGRLKEEEEAMEYLSKKKYPVNAKDYDLYEEVGQGVSATVYRALCIPLNQVVAIKVFDLERCNNHLDNIHREAHTMGLIDHPNVLRAYCSFMAGKSLWIVMPYMAGGSCLHIMKSAYPDGFEQSVIATLLHEVLKALAYLHAHGHIHRDVKAGNILVDSRGEVKLADFGVSACMFDSGDRQRSRNTFVGTPCWMAPEVMQQLHGYDFKADIWSFGITALELAHGHAPFSKYPPMKVLLMTLQNAPPGLDYERDKKFSKSFKEIVAAGLVKDPKERPTSEKLLKHQFFKHARSNEFLPQAILHGLSPLGDRFRMLKGKEAALLVRNKDVYGDKEQLSQQEYIRGISAWNFDLEDLKRQASLIQDCEGISNTENQDLSGKQLDGLDNLAVKAERLSVEKLNDSNAAKADPSQEDETNGFDNLQCVKSSPASFTKYHLQALEGHVDIHVDDVDAYSSSQKGVSHSNFKQTKELSPSMNDKGTGSLGGDDLEHIIQDTPNSFINPLVGQSINLSTTAASVVPSLRCLLQQNAMKREQILRLIRYVDQSTEGNHTEFVKATGSDEHLLLSSASARERELQSQVIHMQQSIGKLVEELQREKIKNAQLERQLRAFFDKASRLGVVNS